MQAFDYDQPATVADAVRAAAREDAKYIAGGQTLLQSMKLGLIAPSTVVDLGGIAELKGICLGSRRRWRLR
jgi:aerobic carbon-monoxide dehydrogenase medium subunit